ncbi:glycosyltransferase family 52 [Mannheimia varigena]|uniref:glycosyltransferase family 52 n=1 Tax=Mannheimia varigena TaxID=85404 RepID=UPI0003E334DA|nr:glycosyltransferase family 52 [Mannheimia varigena]AHG76947.1 sialyltransferase [Mannheimia varigena USDA-ARS-USMARC-1312]
MNLIICFTPFQVLLAEKIIEKHSNEEFYGILIQEGSGYQKNPKYEYYYCRLQKKCLKSKYVVFNNNTKISHFFSLLYSKLIGLRLPIIDKIFLAGLRSDISFILLGTVKSNIIITYDDGIGSLYSNSRFVGEMRGLLKKLIFRLLNSNYTSLKIIEQSKKHFTIYQSMDNFRGKLEYISLISQKEKSNFELSSIDRKISIFIGQPIYEAIAGKMDRDNVELISRVIEKYQVDFYFPHPRENYKIPNVSYIETSLIFEDYILEYMKANPGSHITLYNFLSGAALNLIGLPNLSVVCIKPDNLNEFWYGMYEMFENNQNISMVPFKVVCERNE